MANVGDQVKSLVDCHPIKKGTTGIIKSLQTDWAIISFPLEFLNTVEIGLGSHEYEVTLENLIYSQSNVTNFKDLIDDEILVKEKRKLNGECLECGTRRRLCIDGLLPCDICQK